MGYDIHITRRAEWCGEGEPEISLAEWLAYVENDPEIRLDGYAQADLQDGSVLRIDDPSMAVWVAHPDHGDGVAWIWWSRGNVQAKNPDEPTLRKMWAIAQAFGAKVQGDEGELYDSVGRMIPQDSPAHKAMPAQKPWWRIW